MNESEPLVQLPVPSTFTLVMLGLGFALLLFAAVGYEFNRRRQRFRTRRALEWRAAHEIFEERNLGPESVALLERIIERHAPETPLRAVTTRDGFERCVEPEMSDLRSKKNAGAFEETGIHLRDIRTELGLDYIPVGQRIHSTRELHESQWVSVSRPDEKKPQWVRMMVEDVNEAYLSLGIKEEQDSTVPHFDSGDTVRCRLWRDEDARYIFDTKVARYSDEPPTWKLHHTHQLDRTQTRADFRVRHDQPVSLGIANAPLDGRESKPGARPLVTRIRGRITSLSAGGCAVVVNQPVSRQVQLRLQVELPSEMILEADARIVSSAAISGGRYLIRARFIGLSDDERDLIAKHVMLKQQTQLAEQNQPG